MLLGGDERAGRRLTWFWWDVRSTPLHLRVCIRSESRLASLPGSSPRQRLIAYAYANASAGGERVGINEATTSLS